MALDPSTIKAFYPLPAYNYIVEIDGETIAFSQVSGLSVSYETTTYKESPTESGIAGPITMRMPAQRSDVTVTLQKGIVAGKSVPTLYKWINATQINQTTKKDIFIRLMDEAGVALISWQVVDAFPTSLEAPTFDASSNDAAIESMQLMADRVIVTES